MDIVKGGVDLLILLYGAPSDYDTIMSSMELLPELQYRRIEVVRTDSFDAFLEKLRNASYDIVLVTANGAEGMEGVIAAQSLRPGAATVWFSDDQGFGAQAYRLNCTYFAVKPITPETVSKAYRAYHHK